MRIGAFVIFLQPEFRERWFDFPFILAALPVPVLVVVFAWRLFRALDESGRVAQARTEPTPVGQTAWADKLPFFCALGLFFLSYTGLGISMWPLIVPPEITIWDAAAPRSSQMFVLVGAAVLIPTILAYTAYTYWLFRGKIQPGKGYH